MYEIRAKNEKSYLIRASPPAKRKLAVIRWTEELEVEDENRGGAKFAVRSANMQLAIAGAEIEVNCRDAANFNYSVLDELAALSK